MAGANGTMGILMVTFAAGLALAPPGPVFLRILKIVGGLFLLFLAGDAIRTALKPVDPAATASSRHGGTPFLRGVFAVLLNPGAWVFLITTASAVFATAEHNGGRPLALSTAVAMLAGVALIDGTMVLLGDGFSRFERSFTPLLSPILGVALAVFGVILLVQGIRG